jgi:hypothetical protein
MHMSVEVFLDNNQIRILRQTRPYASVYLESETCSVVASKDL